MNKTNDKQSSLTEAQVEAITLRGKNLLVSASAGSGKTFVMIERIKSLIMSHEASVEDLLVVTFTKAAASEMRERIVQGLEAIEEKDDYIKEQILLLPTASVSTLHSFCAKLLRTYFYVIGLDPAFTLIDELESFAIKQKALSSLVNSKFIAGDHEFFKLLDIFSINRKEDNFFNVILRFHDLILTNPDPLAWFSETIENSYNLTPDKSRAGQYIYRTITKEFERLKSTADKILISLAKLQATKLIEVVNSIYINILKVLSAKSLTDLSTRLLEFEPLQKMPGKVDEELVDLKEVVKEFRDDFKSISEKAIDYTSVIRVDDFEARTKITRERIISLYNYTIEFKSIYDEMKKEKVALDFSDLELNALKLLKNDSVKAQVRDKYKAVFIDEYQDTNLIQEAIIREIVRENNLFMVGDVKQSIYKFRASEPQIFVDKYKLYKSESTLNSKVIDLNHNFRSHQDILEFCNDIFKRVMTEEFGQVDYLNSACFKKSEPLYPENTKNPSVKVELILSSGRKKEDVGDLPLYSVKNHQLDNQESLKKAEAEGRIIAKNILSLVGSQIYDAKKKAMRSLDFSDISILTSKRGEYLELVLKELKKNGILYSSDIASDVFEDRYMATIKSMLEVILNPHQDISLLGVMNSSLFDFSIDELSKIREADRTSKFYYQATNNAINSEKIDAKLKKKLLNFTKKIEELQFFSKYMKVDELINKILEVTNFNTEIQKDKDGDKSIALLNKFLNFINGKSYNQSLTKFLDYIEGNTIEFDQDVEDRGVKVTTIHKSKGLEYPVVILMGAGQDITKRSAHEFHSSKNFGIGIDYYDTILRTKAPTLVKNAIKLETEREEKEERLRLLYVALTRAKNHLIVVGTRKEGEQIVPPPSAKTFLDWIMPAILDYNERINKNYNLELNYYTERDILSNEIKGGNQLPCHKKGTEDFSGEIAKVLYYEYPYLNSVDLPVKTTVSEMLAKDRDDYIAPEIFKSSSSSVDAIKKGLAYHKILELIPLKINSIEELKCEVQKLLDSKKLFSEELKFVNLNHIFGLLTNDKFKEITKGRVYREQEFIALTKVQSDNGAEVKDSVILQGIVDLISVTDDGVIIVDYKTNNYKSEEKFIEAYKKQLDIYADVISESYGKPVKQKLIYSFSLGRFIYV